MGIIVNFAARRDRAPSRASAERGPREACQIIILPCVRYERWSDETAKTTPQKKKRSKRRARSR